MGFADRGVFAEKKLKEYLEPWEAANQYREFTRLTDSKAAGRIIKAAKADFEYFSHELGTLCTHGLIEVKETEHDYRLSRSKVSQLPGLRKRDKAGGRCCVLVYHSKLKKWRVASVEWLWTNGDKGSWNLTNFPLFDTCGQALHSFIKDVFP